MQIKSLAHLNEVQNTRLRQHKLLGIKNIPRCSKLKAARAKSFVDFSPKINSDAPSGCIREITTKTNHYNHKRCYWFIRYAWNAIKAQTHGYISLYSKWKQQFKFHHQFYFVAISHERFAQHSPDEAFALRAR